MSVFRRPNAKEYSYDFRFKGNRFSGSTGETDKRKAQAFEKAHRDHIKSTIIDTRKPLNFAEASTLYWQEVGQHHKRPSDTMRTLAWLQEKVGMSTMLDSITASTIARLIQQRKAEGVANASVNRSVQEPMRGILNRAKTIWGVPVNDIHWKALKLREPTGRIRTLSHDEEIRYFATLRPDYAPFMRFALMSGARLNEICNLEWRDIDWRGRTIHLRITKGDRPRTIPLSNGLHELLKPLERAAAEVFTYKVKAARIYPRGSLQPIQYEGVKITHRRTCAKAKIEGLRFHDLRHSFATRFMKATGKEMHLKLILGHAQGSVTSRYVHLDNEDLMDAMHQLESATQSATRKNATRDKLLK